MTEMDRQPAILYTLVANGGTPLAEYALTTGKYYFTSLRFFFFGAQAFAAQTRYFCGNRAPYTGRKDCSRKERQNVVPI